MKWEYSKTLIYVVFGSRKITCITERCMVTSAQNLHILEIWQKSTKIQFKISVSHKFLDPIQTAYLRGPHFLRPRISLYVMRPHKRLTNCNNVQCIAARIRMISPLGKSTFTPIAYQSRLQWLKGVGFSISNYTIFQIFFLDQDSLSVLFIHLYSSK